MFALIQSADIFSVLFLLVAKQREGSKCNKFTVQHRKLVLD